MDCIVRKSQTQLSDFHLMVIGRTDADSEAEAPILWLPNVKRQLIRKDPDAGKMLGKKAGVEEDDRERDGWMASLTQCT